MRITRIKVQNYRSIEKVDIGTSEFNVLVGQNNHGKTNFFEAINWFYKEKDSPPELKFLKDKNRKIIVEIEYVGALDEVEAMKNEKNSAAIKRVLGGNDVLTVKKTSEDHKRVLILDGEEIKNPAGFDTALNDFLPKLEYVTTKIRLADVSAYKTTSPIGKMLSGVLSAIIEENPEYAAFKEKFTELFAGEDSEVRIELNKLGDKVEIYLLKQFPDGTKINFNVNTPIFEDLLKNFETEVDDGILTSAEEKGDGMQRAIMLSIIQAYADFRKTKGAGKSFLFLIDEAELHLHPTGQRALKRALLDATKQGDQVFINTHSSVLVTDHHDIQKIFKVEKQNKKTDIREIEEEEKMNVVYDLLGGSPTDILLPRNFLIVEGKSEFAFISDIIIRHYPTQRRGIQVTFSGGDIDEQEGSLHGIHKMYNPLATSDNPIYKNKVVILCDNPKSERQISKLDQFKKGYPYLVENGQLFILDTNTLEEYYPNDWKKTYEESKALGTSKVEYARKVAANISKEEFEKQMPIIYEAISKCWDIAFEK